MADVGQTRAADDCQAVIVEDSKAVQEALTELLATLRGFEIVGIVVTEAGATDWLYHHWGGRGLLILDLLIQDGYGLNRFCRVGCA